MNEDIGTNVDDSVIDVLFHFIEIGLFPCLRIMDFYGTNESCWWSLGCSLTSQAVLRLIQWLTQFPFIDVLSPDLLSIHYEWWFLVESKLAPNTFSQLSALLTDSQGAPQTLDIRSINFPLLLSRCQSWWWRNSSSLWTSQSWTSCKSSYDISWQLEWVRRVIYR